MNRKILVVGAFVLTYLFVLSEPALAGPGGTIAKAVFETFWGKVLLAALIIFFLPLISYVLFREKLSERRARRDLRFMAAYSSSFDWIKIRERATDCFYRVHSGWESEDLSGIAEWMTDWYWQNQQMVHLDKWKQAGLQNICEVKKISNIRPLLFVHRNNGAEHEDSVVILAIEANMKDYLQIRSSQEVVEGSKKYKDVETVWTFTIEEGKWKVSNIEDGSLSLAYAKLVKELPTIESTVVSDLRA